jgi:HSP20 family molecular chaperone IbpA
MIMETKNDVVKTAQQNVEQATEYFEMLPLVDSYENKDEIILLVDMPGIEKKELEISVDNGVLCVSGFRGLETRGSAIREEFGNVEFKRSFSIPQTIDNENIEAELKDGVLKLHLPKSEAAKPRLVEIKTA